MTEAKTLKGKLRGGASYGTLPELVTRVCVDDKLGLLEENQEWGGGRPSSRGTASSSSNSSSSHVVSQHTQQLPWSPSKRSAGTSFKGASKQDTYDLWNPRRRSGSLSSDGSSSSEEVFSRSGSSSSSSHCHHLVSERPEDQRALLKLSVAAGISLVFMVLEYIGGYYSSSLAVLSDAGHLLCDFCGFLVSLVAIWLMRRPPSRFMSFGYYRAEVLGSVASVLMVWLVTGLLVAAALHRLLYQKYLLDPDLMLIMAAIGIIVNIVIVGVLHGCGCRGNYHGAHKSARGNINLRAALIHVVGDTLQTLAVLMAALVVKFWVSPAGG
ncbi:zinc transporter ttm-1-like [Procambarus clarkii]|uniref:zinc transporter ttm-1-like n=1 Tax=Procambarus clarkii TaxID=6728 RepID=UPI001E6771A9|nr:zinc transporter ttm-1-like isoform X3 [Procambarus clarkii]XP_045583131.1 zinc transporter ttm-1-like isoform X3 [Procambarus clarkii]XP_045583140.1 zinc transporter ttm-1-like isoform X3 [Procambarus clarkii]XP_045583151.1 zinc transporter ttm-1-like isoform X3 [Procambarus clarkii]